MAENPSERFYRLVWPERGAVYRLARILLGDGHASDDLVQDAMLKAFRSIGSFREGTNVRSWLRQIVRNASVDRIRVDKARPTISLDAMGSELSEPATADAAAGDGTGWERPEELLEAFSDDQIIEALQKLPEDIRWTLLLVDVEQVDQAEAAKILEVPVGTVKSRTSRGRAMLRSMLLPVARERRLM